MLAVLLPSTVYSMVYVVLTCKCRRRVSPVYSFIVLGPQHSQTIIPLSNCPISGCVDFTTGPLQARGIRAQGISSFSDVGVR
jgi:hypothetical protein